MKIIILLFLFITQTFITQTFAELEPEIIEKLRKYNLSHPSCAEIEKNLVALNVEYIDFEGNHKKDGLIIVSEVIAPEVLNIFKELMEIKFQVGGIDPFKGVNEKLEPDDDYNYTGSYSCRNMQGGNKPSIHSIGMAIDINPLQNPFLLIDPKEKIITKIIPKDGIFFLNRENFRKGMITKEVIEIFAKNGFTVWGGKWNQSIDYHHFQLPSELARRLALLPAKEARKEFEKHLQLQSPHHLVPSE